jgi:vacuolar-type H+-ATPase subunit E/Vma4
MGLEKIRQTVLAEAKAEATRILEVAQKNKASLLKIQKEEADQEFDRIRRFRMQAIEEEFNRKLIQLKGVANKQILDKRNVLLRTLFERAKGEILSWPEEKYRKVMRRFLEKTAGSQEGRVRVSPEDTDVFQRILYELNASGVNTGISLDQTAPLPGRGGFVFVSANFEVDQALDTMLKEIEHDLLPAIAQNLFPGK